MADTSNNPPPDAAFSIHIDELFSLLSDTLAGGEIDNDDKEAAIDAIQDDFHKAWKDADKARATEKKPFDEGVKEVQTRWKPIVDKADRGKKACSEALTPYRTAKQADKDRAVREAREEAEARQKAAQDALRASEDLEQRFEAEKELEVAKKLEAQANRIDRSATGLRTYYEAEITNKKDALLFYIKHQPEAFTALIQTLADRDARGARPQVPGIVYHQKQKAN